MILSILGFGIFKILVHLIFIRFNLVRILISSTLRLTYITRLVNDMLLIKEETDRDSYFSYMSIF